TVVGGGEQPASIGAVIDRVHRPCVTHRRYQRRAGARVPEPRRFVDRAAEHCVAAGLEGDAGDPVLMWHAGPAVGARLDVPKLRGPVPGRCHQSASIRTETGVKNRFEMTKWLAERLATAYVPKAGGVIHRGSDGHPAIRAERAKNNSAIVVQWP